MLIRSEDSTRSTTTRPPEPAHWPTSQSCWSSTSRDGTGPARLLDMVEGRSKQALKQWLNERHHAWRDEVEVVAMDGFTSRGIV